MPMPITPTIFLDDRAGNRVQEFLWDALHHQPETDSHFAVVSDNFKVLREQATRTVIEGFAKCHQGDKIRYRNRGANAVPELYVPKQAPVDAGNLHVFGVLDQHRVFSLQRLRGRELIGAWIYGSYAFDLQRFIRTYEELRVGLHKR